MKSVSKANTSKANTLHHDVSCWLVVLLLLGLMTPAMAADRYWDGNDTTADADGGSGTWTNGTSLNWDDAATGGTDVTWSSATPDSAIFGGTGGTVTLGEDITISNLTIAVPGYTITGNMLHFATNGAIGFTSFGTEQSDNGTVTFTCGITNSPDLDANFGSDYKPWFSYLYLSPTAESMTIGTITRPLDNALYLTGTTTGNSIDAIIKGNGNAKVYKEGTGTWTLGDAYGNQFRISDGDLIANGEITTQGGFSLNGGVLHFNNAGAFGADGNTLIFNGGDLDNSSGAAITAAYATPLSWNADWTFIGSNGTNSDLNLGTGTATMNADRTITIQDADTTVTVGGPVSDGLSAYSLTKAGSGTLVLNGLNAYDSDTTVDAGTLTISQASMSALGSVSIAAGATLNLSFSGTNEVLAVYTNGVKGPTGTWGPSASGADNETDLIEGDGILNVPAPVLVEGIRYWDGGTNDISGPGNMISDGGVGTWNTTLKNWDAGTVVHTNWVNASNDVAVFAGSGGTVTVGEPIQLGGLSIGSAGYTITGSMLSFSPTGTISFTTYPENGDVTIASGITNSPDIVADFGASSTPWNSTFYLSPKSESMTLGTISRPIDNYVVLDGTTHGNTVEAIPQDDGNAKVRKAGTGTWRVAGDLWGGNDFDILGGTLIINGDVGASSGPTISSGATLAGTCTIDRTVTVPSGATLAPGDPTGTMTVTNNGCTIDGTLEITVDGAQYSSLYVDPAYGLTISNAVLSVTEVAVPSSPMMIAGYGAGMLSGTFATTNMPDNWLIDYNYASGTAIALVPPPRGTLLIVR